MSRTSALQIRTVLVWLVAGFLLMGTEGASADGLMQAMPPSTAYAYPSTDDPAALDVLAAPADVEMEPISAIPDHYYAYKPWSWQLLPDGLIYKSYLAGGREPRFAAQWSTSKDGNSVWDITLGGRAAILRYGTDNPLWPEGWELDIEGAAFPRLTLDSRRDLVAVDFRFGVPITYRQGPWETKVAYYHLSSHMGDEFMLSHPDAVRINYARDVFLWGLGWRPHPDWRFYGEVGWAVYVSGGAEPWEFQFGAEYSPAAPSTIWGAPFFAINSRLREEVDFGGNLIVETGWQWRGQTGRLLRFGFYYFNGKSDQFQFHLEEDEQFALGLWYDF